MPPFLPIALHAITIGLASQPASAARSAAVPGARRAMLSVELVLLGSLIAGALVVGLLLLRVLGRRARGGRISAVPARTDTTINPWHESGQRLLRTQGLADDDTRDIDPETPPHPRPGPPSTPPGTP